MIVYNLLYNRCKAAFAQLATHRHQDHFTTYNLARVPSSAAITVMELCRGQSPVIARGRQVAAGPARKITSPGGGRDGQDLAGVSPGLATMINRGRGAVPGTRPGEAVGEGAMSACCRLCEAVLVRAADTRTDEYIWVDLAGRTYGRDADLAHIPGPYGHLADLAERAVRGDWAAAREYGALKVRLDAGCGYEHAHWTDGAGEPHLHPGPVPECCDYPAWLRPSGWQCRRCKRRLPVPVPLLAPVRRPVREAASALPVRAADRPVRGPVRKPIRAGRRPR